jgi:transposase
VAGLEEFSREDLIALVCARAELIEELRAEVAELKPQAGRNPQNSSTPPSADGLAEPPPRSMRTRSGRKPGKQGGTAGFRLARVAGPAERVRHFPVRCGGCDRRL